MNIEITQQLLLFGGSILLGVCMGVTYDVLRAFRLRFPRLSGLLDAFCCLVCAAAAFFYVLRWGGELRLYILLGCAGGCVLFFCLASALLRPLWAIWVELMVVLVGWALLPLRFLHMLFVKLAGYAKNLFLFSCKWGTIWNYKWAVIRIHRKRGAMGMATKVVKKKKRKRTKGGMMTKVLILALLALFGTQLYRIQDQVKDAEEQQATLSAQVDYLRQENERLTQDIENGDNQELMEKIARDKLGLVTPGEKVFYNHSN